MRTGSVRNGGHHDRMPETTATRLLRLLPLLTSRPAWRGEELAEALGVTPRTVRRDVERLRDLGYPVAATPGSHGGYSLRPGNGLPPLLLDDDSAVAVAIGLRTVATHGMGEAAAPPAAATHPGPPAPPPPPPRARAPPACAPSRHTAWKNPPPALPQRSTRYSRPGSAIGSRLSRPRRYRSPQLIPRFPITTWRSSPRHANRASGCVSSTATGRVLRLGATRSRTGWCRRANAGTWWRGISTRRSGAASESTASNRRPTPACGHTLRIRRMQRGSSVRGSPPGRTGGERALC